LQNNVDNELDYYYYYYHHKYVIFYHLLTAHERNNNVYFQENADHIYSKKLLKRC